MWSSRDSWSQLSSTSVTGTITCSGKKSSETNLPWSLQNNTNLGRVLLPSKMDWSLAYFAGGWGGRLHISRPAWSQGWGGGITLCHTVHTVYAYQATVSASVAKVFTWIYFGKIPQYWDGDLYKLRNLALCNDNFCQLVILCDSVLRVSKYMGGERKGCLCVERW